MTYLSAEYRILRYLWKIAKYGLATAHLVCMKAAGSDFQRLVDLRNQEACTGVNVGWQAKNDAEIDEVKLKELFISRQTMADADFDNALSFLRSNGCVHPTKFEITLAGIVYFEPLETQFELEAKQRSNNIKQAI